MKKIAIALMCVCLLVTPSLAGAWDIKLYAEGGGMGLIEMDESKGYDVSEGHKFFYLAGIDFIYDNMSFGIEGFSMGEPVDEDPEIFHCGGSINGRYFFTMHNVTPYVGGSFNHWSRERNIFYPEGQYQAEVVNFATIDAGFHFKPWKWLYVDIGALFPVWTDITKGELGIDTGIGVEYKRFAIGYHYKQVNFDGMSVPFSGCLISYTF